MRILNEDFRQTVSEIGMLMAYEVTRTCRLKSEGQNAGGRCEAYVLKNPWSPPILRAGLGMVDGIALI